MGEERERRTKRWALAMAREKEQPRSGFMGRRRNVKRACSFEHFVNCNYFQLLFSTVKC